MLEDYINIFSKLGTYTVKEKCPALATNKSPHKPFLLLSIMDLIAQGTITENFIEPTLELVEAFNAYWASVMPSGWKTSMAHPFPRLEKDGFWTRITNPGYDPEHEYNVSTMTRLREIYAGAKMDDELFLYFCNPETREKLRATLINTYFAPEIRPVLIELGIVNLASYRYSQELIRRGKDAEKGWGQNDESSRYQKIRDQGFRKVITQLYDHRCALCGIRMLTPEGHTIVEAAHIKPWHKSNDDSPTNGMALCRLCHWSFDEGLMSVGKNYEVKVSERVRLGQNNPGHIFTLADRQILKPQKKSFWPSAKNTDWHRKNVFVA